LFDLVIPWQILTLSTVTATENAKRTFLQRNATSIRF